jgi:hypothetical protein
MGNFQCKKCHQEIKFESANFCSNCGTKVDKPSYDESIEASRFPEIREQFLQRYLPDIKVYLNSVLNEDLHKKILQTAASWTTWCWAHRPDTPRRKPRVDEVKKDLIKIYRRYYNVHKKGLMPIGTIRLMPDPTYQNFKNRMKIVSKDSDIITELDR